LGHAYAVAGRKADAKRLLSLLKARAKQEYIPAADMATICMALGQYDEAFEWLERAYRDRSLLLLFLNVEPNLEQLRSDPRSTELLRRIGLPP
jgi:hypothetical protein